MAPTKPTCREAAADCRRAALSSTEPKMWILLAEQWEWLADTADGMHLLARELAHLQTKTSPTSSVLRSAAFETKAAL
jgi:hypothetical protein